MAKKIYASSVPRAHETWKIVQKTLNSLWEDISLRIRDEFSFNDPEYYSTKIIDEWKSVKDKSDKTEDEFVEDFLDGKRETKPILLAKPYIKRLKQIFDRVVRKNKKFSIIAFRHWDKDLSWELSDLWKKQAESLWQYLHKNNNDEDVIFIATHNTINEAIIRCLFFNKSLPEKWKSPLGFVETVKYTFYPKIKDKEPYMEIEWRWQKRRVSYKQFDKVLEKPKK